ncbi:Shedu immune nuclease family protein [Microbacterium sp. Leaf151]|uniref:Shedu immune nuclease family protein n=1 Tax=Microbacterium sp. Leaf151 TaxID=1736276 RepID=UPI0006FF382B|nr:Shedu immune nuclease family protein [Microbacterium sp. Leaf151]KQR23190.1 hypothetical protein ASF76_08170 [Microbacterium sp. Leaf151]
MSFAEWIKQIDDLHTWDMSKGDLTTLEIRPGTDAFHYFYDPLENRLIKDFLLDDRPRVSLHCEVRLIDHGGKYSPRVRLWKRDRSKKATQLWETGEIPGSHIVKALVDTGDGHEHFLTLMAYLVELSGVTVGDRAVRVVDATDADIVSALRARSRADVVPMIESVLDSPLNGAEIAALSGRKSDLEEFETLLTDNAHFEREAADGSREAVWQRFFERATWIFGYGLNLVSHAAMDDGKLERITVGNNIFTGAGKRSDAIMRTRALISTLLFCEIKKHDTPLLSPGRPYREPDVYSPSAELVGGTAQLQKTVRKAYRLMINQVEKHTTPDGTPTGLDFSTTRPRQVLLVGSLDEFRTDAGVNAEKMESFELYRRAQAEVEIITFDELLERARFIVAG